MICNFVIKALSGCFSSVVKGIITLVSGLNSFYLHISDYNVGSLPTFLHFRTTTELVGWLLLVLSKHLNVQLLTHQRLFIVMQQMSSSFKAASLTSDLIPYHSDNIQGFPNCTLLQGTTQRSIPSTPPPPN